jgi:hypothetical protein
MVKHLSPHQSVPPVGAVFRQGMKLITDIAGERVESLLVPRFYD